MIMAIATKSTCVIESSYDKRVNADGITLRLFQFKAEEHCILYFPDSSDFGIDFLMLEPGVLRTIALPDGSVDIDFKVYRRVDPEKLLTDPPPIHP